MTKLKIKEETKIFRAIHKDKKRDKEGEIERDN